MDTHPAIGKSAIALLHQDGFDELGVQNSHYGLPAIKNPKPRESHGQCIAHSHAEQKQSAALCMDLCSPQGPRSCIPSDKAAKEMRNSFIMQQNRRRGKKGQGQTQTA